MEARCRKDRGRGKRGTVTQAKYLAWLHKHHALLHQHSPAGRGLLAPNPQPNAATNAAFASSLPATALTHPSTASRCPCTLLREPVRKARGPANQAQQKFVSSPACSSSSTLLRLTRTICPPMMPSGTILRRGGGEKEFSGVCADKKRTRCAPATTV